MKRSLLIAGAAILALGACNRNANTTAASDTPAVSSADTVPPTDTATAASSAATPTAGTAATPAAPDFVTMAAASDMYEIQAAKIAEKRSKNAEVKAFAKMMVTDHTKSTAMVKKAVKDAGRTDIMPPSALPSDKQAMIDALNKASDADFDKTYVDQQVMAHTDALALMQGYASGGDVAQLKDAAGMIAPVVQMHLDKIKSIQSSLK